MDLRPNPWTVVARSGRSWTQLAVDAPTRLNPVLQWSPAVLIMVGGTSDLLKEHDTATKALADFVAYAQAARSAGAAAVIVGTVTPATAFSAVQEARRVDLNGRIRLNVAGAWDATADLATALPDPSDANFYYDGLHWTERGAAVAAAVVNVVLTPLLALT